MLSPESKDAAVLGKSCDYALLQFAVSGAECMVCMYGARSACQELGLKEEGKVYRNVFARSKCDATLSERKRKKRKKNRVTL